MNKYLRILEIEKPLVIIFYSTLKWSWLLRAISNTKLVFFLVNSNQVPVVLDEKLSERNFFRFSK